MCFTRLTILLPACQHTCTGFQTSLILKAFLATFGILFCHLLMVPDLMHDPAGILICYSSSSSWPHLMFFELKIANILKSSGQGLDKNEFLYPYRSRCVSCRIISLPSFNGLCCTLTKIALFLYLIKYQVECMTPSVFSFVCCTHFSYSYIAGTNADI